MTVEGGSVPSKDIDQEFRSIVDGLEMRELRNIGPGKGTLLAILTGLGVQATMVACVAAGAGPIPVTIAGGVFMAGVFAMARMIKLDRNWALPYTGSETGR